MEYSNMVDKRFRTLLSILLLIAAPAGAEPVAPAKQNEASNMRSALTPEQFEKLFASDDKAPDNNVFKQDLPADEQDGFGKKLNKKKQDADSALSTQDLLDRAFPARDNKRQRFSSNLSGDDVVKYGVGFFCVMLFGSAIFRQPLHDISLNLPIPFLNGVVAPVGLNIAPVVNGLKQVGTVESPAVQTAINNAMGTLITVAPAGFILAVISKYGLLPLELKAPAAGLMLAYSLAGMLYSSYQQIQKA
jgi:hypothetical protein